MFLVNQSHCLIAILLQSLLYIQIIKLKIELRFEVLSSLFIHGYFTHIHSIGSIEPI
jgi:hypothetical protein